MDKLNFVLLRWSFVAKLVVSHFGYRSRFPDGKRDTGWIPVGRHNFTLVEHLDSMLIVINF